MALTKCPTINELIKRYINNFYVSYLEQGIYIYVKIYFGL